MLNSKFNVEKIETNFMASTAISLSLCAGDPTTTCVFKKLSLEGYNFPLGSRLLNDLFILHKHFKNF